VTRLRKFLGGAFGLLGLIYLFISISAVPLALKIMRGEGVPSNPRYPIAEWILFAVIPTLFAICFLGSAWTIRRGSPAARPWSIAASLILLLQSVPILLHPLSKSAQRIPGTTLVIAFIWAFFALGVAGMVAFIPRNSATQGLPRRVKPPRVAGDGTSSGLDVIAWIISVLGYFALMSWWREWARSEGLPSGHGLLSLLLLCMALFLSVAVHESGHALAGMCLGMKLRLFFVGPFQLRVRDGRWSFEFNLGNSLAAGGATGCVPTVPDWDPIDEIWMIAAGPIASFALGLVTAGLALSAKGSSYERSWIFFAYMAAISLVGAVVNLLPIRPNSYYSDGAQIYQLLKGGAWADLHRVRCLVLSSLATPLRPREYDLNAIQKAELSFTHGIDALLLRLYKSQYFLDCELFDQARDAYHEAVALYPAVAPFVTGDLLTAFVFRSALLDRDLDATRQWWQKLASSKPSHFGFDYALAAAALRWIEGDLFEAQSLWQQATDLADAMPNVGAYEFDRHLCELLRAAISNARAAQQAPNPQANSEDRYRDPNPAPIMSFSVM
jgi:tetratricopeptide (TPR) repeat protein